MSGQARTGAGQGNARPSACLPRARSVANRALGFERSAPTCDGMASLSACGGSAPQSLVVTNCAALCDVFGQVSKSVPAAREAKSLTNQQVSVSAIVGTLVACSMVPDSGATGDKATMDKQIANIVSTHIKVTRGPFGWTAEVRNGNGVILGYGFAALADHQPQEGRAVALRAALSQLA